MGEKFGGVEVMSSYQLLSHYSSDKKKSLDGRSESAHRASTSSFYYLYNTRREIHLSNKSESSHDCCDKICELLLLY
jgi:hypothetical protein